MNNIIPLTPVYDRSRVVQDWKCPRSRYWNYEYAGRGVVSKSTSLPLYMGITIHDALEAIASTTAQGAVVDIDQIATLAFFQMRDNLWEEGDAPEVQEFANEQGSLVEGMLRGFFKAVWPNLIARYPKILFTEGEMKYSRDGLEFMSKPDLILGNDDETIYVEYKSTSTKKDSWINSWATAVQLHSTVAAVAATTGIKIDAVLVQGLYKGYESYGKQSSPFCYAYRRKGNPPFSKDEFSYDYKAGFTRFPVWQLEGGVKKWVDDMPEVVLADQFPQTPPIYINEDLVEDFFSQRSLREREIFNAVEQLLTGADEKPLLNKVFPQKFDQCIPSFGWPCDYRTLCHGPQIDPIKLGYVYREPHHEPENEIIQARIKRLENDQN